MMTTYKGKKEASHKAFAMKFAIQVKDLIKREPRLVKNTNNAFNIYYYYRGINYQFVLIATHGINSKEIGYNHSEAF